MTPASSKDLLYIQATIECGFFLKRVRDVTRTYSQMHRTDKYSLHSSIIWTVWLNSWVFVYDLKGSWFKSSCSHQNFRFRACFEHVALLHSGDYRVWIHSERGKWHNKNIQSNAWYKEALTTQLNHLGSLAKCLTVRLWPKWLWFRVQLRSLKHQIWSLCEQGFAWH